MSTLRKLQIMFYREVNNWDLIWVGVDLRRLTQLAQASLKLTSFTSTNVKLCQILEIQPSPDFHLTFTWQLDHHLNFPWPFYLTLISCNLLKQKVPRGGWLVGQQISNPISGSGSFLDVQELTKSWPWPWAWQCVNDNLLILGKYIPESGIICRGGRIL